MGLYIMQKSDLLQIFFSLKEDEIRDAKRFLASPYFNKREDVVLLFDFLVKMKKKERPDFSREKAFDFIFPKTTFDDTQMRHTMSYLVQLLYTFLSLREWEAAPARQQLDLHKSLRTRNLEKQSERKSVEIVTYLEREPLRDMQHHFSKYLWQKERYATIQKKRRTGEMHLSEMTEEFTIFYLSEALRQGCLLISHQNMNKKNYDLSFFEEILQWVERRKMTETLAVSVYYHSFLALTKTGDEIHFFQLKKLLTDEWAAFPEEEMRDLYLIAINYCIKKQNLGNATFVQEGFDLYKLGLENKILLENGILSVYTYKNVHLLADKLQFYDWILTFLEDYKIFLPAEQRENHYNFNVAQYFFRRKNYQKAMPLLQTIEFSDVLHNLDARKMLLIMYYELGEHDTLEALMESFKTYLLRKKELSYHRESYLILLKYTRQLLLLPLMTNEEKTAFLQEVNEVSTFTEKSWIVAKIQLSH
jgi:hypothetical protein